WSAPADRQSQSPSGCCRSTLESLAVLRSPRSPRRAASSAAEREAIDRESPRGGHRQSVSRLLASRTCRTVPASPSRPSHSLYLWAPPTSGRPPSSKETPFLRGAPAEDREAKAEPPAASCWQSTRSVLRQKPTETPQGSSVVASTDSLSRSNASSDVA